MKRKQRLDTLLVETGLVESREKARALILAGQVDVDGHGAAKAGTMVPVDADVRVIGPDHPWVSRGGIKLAHALEAFGIDATGAVALDIGASTGGFTDVWLHRGARHVIALDVGHSQLHWKMRSDPRVTVIEHTNARYLKPGDLPDAGSPITRVSIDVSFISLSHMFPVVPPLVAAGADIIALVKPQFEAGRKDVGKGGLVHDPDVHTRVVAAVTSAAAEVGLMRIALVDSPITGAREHGNREFLMQPAMRVGIAVKPGLVAAHDMLVELEDWLKSRGVEAVWSTEAAKVFTAGSRTVTDRIEIPKQSDLVIVLGGDGTLLGMAKAIAESGHDVPILGVNFGSLGFLTEITRPEIFTSIESVIASRAVYDLRMMLRTVATLAVQPALLHMALNDVVFSRTALSRIIELEVSVGGQLVAAVKADGLIVATPTGSTAYNLAAGGPIVHPAMDALLLTPIAPHTLTNRPIVIPPEREVRVRSTGSNAGDEVYVTVDGQTGFGMHEGDEIAITRAERPLRLVRSTTRSYFEVLRQKLKWNER